MGCSVVWSSVVADTVCHGNGVCVQTQLRQWRDKFGPPGASEWLQVADSALVEHSKLGVFHTVRVARKHGGSGGVVTAARLR